jgi:hypothetical protein
MEPVHQPERDFGDYVQGCSAKGAQKRARGLNLSCLEWRVHSNEGNVRRRIPPCDFRKTLLCDFQFAVLYLSNDLYDLPAISLYFLE